MENPDSYYLEVLSREVFGMVIDGEPVASRWSAMKKAFYDFDVDRVASIRNNNIFSIIKIIKNPDIIRNYRKIKATGENAQEFKQIRKEYGSFENYLRSFPNRKALVDNLTGRIHYISKPSVERFLSMVGF